MATRLFFYVFFSSSSCCCGPFCWAGLQTLSIFIACTSHALIHARTHLFTVIIGRLLCSCASVSACCVLLLLLIRNHQSCCCCCMQATTTTLERFHVRARRARKCERDRCINLFMFAARAASSSSSSALSASSTCFGCCCCCCINLFNR